VVKSLEKIAKEKALQNTDNIPNIPFLKIMVIPTISTCLSLIEAKN
jgi:hypothetical protein